MSLLTGLACLLWLLLTGVSALGWRAPRGSQPRLSRTPVLIAVLLVEVVATGGVALLGALGTPLEPPWSWFAVVLAASASLLCGGVVTSCVLALADASSRPGGPRVRRTILRGGTWIGALERLALTATLVAGWPEGLAAIVAVKAFARYPELKAGPTTGAIERFIIGSFTSLGWAAVCAGTALVLT
ncbi:MAG: hypothetical protein AVDCRST_MAG61-1729 [uncultured Friedmanniella sp.]|uniref:Uncharacterized protein n=1 Tax=uncultured Friedmanniella sp. TaxID=335381 RepID=A0A6J4KQB3_9ACTN|nr:hypothetical protein [uncultured Friedmanniella sp.]CAA9311147.1 MAG: hypothetical protein AVDCRST_MAG61-1729 [uncultured Friedmanniella sp.]